MGKKEKHIKELAEEKKRAILSKWVVKAESIAEMKRTCVPCWKGGEV